MAHTASAVKRARQNIERRARNRAWKSLSKTVIKKLQQAVQNKDPKAPEILKSCVSSIDKAVAKGALHSNTGARRKARLYRILNG